MAESKADKETLMYSFSVESNNNIVIFISSFKSSTHKNPPPVQKNDLCHSSAFLDEMQLQFHIQMTTEQEIKDAVAPGRTFSSK